jgi:Protein of unknown function (DUF2442)
MTPVEQSPAIDLTAAQLGQAEKRGRQMLETEPRAAKARYDQATGRVVIDLANGCTYAFPAQLVQDLHGASPDALTRVKVDGLGFNLHWPSLDVDLYVPALVSGIFGTRAWVSGNSRAPQDERHRRRSCGGTLERHEEGPPQGGARPTRST